MDVRGELVDLASVRDARESLTRTIHNSVIRTRCHARQRETAVRRSSYFRLLESLILAQDEHALSRELTVPGEEAPANSVPAAAVIQRVRALSGITGRKGRVGGSVSVR